MQTDLDNYISDSVYDLIQTIVTRCKIEAAMEMIISKVEDRISAHTSFISPTIEPPEVLKDENLEKELYCLKQDNNLLTSELEALKEKSTSVRDHFISYINTIIDEKKSIIHYEDMIRNLEIQLYECQQKCIEAENYQSSLVSKFPFYKLDSVVNNKCDSYIKQEDILQEQDIAVTATDDIQTQSDITIIIQQITDINSIYNVSDNIQPKIIISECSHITNINRFLLFSDASLLNIFSFLVTSDVLNYAQTCKGLYKQVHTLFRMESELIKKWESITLQPSFIVLSDTGIPPESSESIQSIDAVNSDLILAQNFAKDMNTVLNLNDENKMVTVDNITVSTSIENDIINTTNTNTTITKMNEDVSTTNILLEKSTDTTTNTTSTTPLNKTVTNNNNNNNNNTLLQGFTPLSLFHATTAAVVAHPTSQALFNANTYITSLLPLSKSSNKSSPVKVGKDDSTSDLTITTTTTTTTTTTGSSVSSSHITTEATDSFRSSDETTSSLASKSPEMKFNGINSSIISPVRVPPSQQNSTSSSITTITSETPMIQPLTSLLSSSNIQISPPISSTYQSFIQSHKTQLDTIMTKLTPEESNYMNELWGVLEQQSNINTQYYNDKLSLQSQVQHLNTQYQELCKKYHDTEVTLFQTTTDFHELQKQNFADQEVISYLDMRGDELEYTNKQYQDELTALQTLYNTLQYQYTQTDGKTVLQLEECEKKLIENENNFKTQKKLLVKEVKSLRQQVDQLTSERNMYRSQIEALRNSLLSIPPSSSSNSTTSSTSTVQISSSSCNESPR